MFINEITLSVKQSKTNLYADDSTLYAIGYSGPVIEKSLENDANSV